MSDWNSPWNFMTHPHLRTALSFKSLWAVPVCFPNSIRVFVVNPQILHKYWHWELHSSTYPNKSVFHCYDPTQRVQHFYLCVVHDAFKPVVQLVKVFVESLGLKPRFPGVFHKVLVQWRHLVLACQVASYVVDVTVAAEGAQCARKCLGSCGKAVKECLFIDGDKTVF